jgi:hypothetical protein
MITVDDSGKVLSVSASSLRVYFRNGATVSVVVENHRRIRSGVSATTIVVTAVTTSDSGTGYGIGNVSGMVADVTGHGTGKRDRGYGGSVVVIGYGNRDHAVSALVSDLARALYGSSTALRSHTL